MRLTAPTTISYVAPTIVVRVSPPGVRRLGAGESALGEIRDDLYPVSLSLRPGEDGGTLVVRSEAYSVSSDPEDLLDIARDWCGRVVTLEVRRRVGNLRVQEVIFRGRFAGVGDQFSGGENGVDLHFSDWDLLDDDPVNYYLGATTLGFALQRLDGLDSAWPTDADGERVGYIDPGLFGLFIGVAGVPVVGQTLRSVFCALVKRDHELSPTIRYDRDGKMVLSADRRGDRPMDLITGQIHTTDAAVATEAFVVEARGFEDWSRIRTRVRGIGGPAMVRDTLTLEPAWNPALTATVLALPNLANAGQASGDVGTLFRVPAQFMPYGVRSAEFEDTKVWARFPILGADPFLVESGSGFEPDPSLHMSTDFDRLSGNEEAFRFVRFDSPAIMRHPETGAWTVLEVQLQGLKKDGTVTVDTGYVGDLPIQRMRTHSNPRVRKITNGTFYEPLASSRTAAEAEEIDQTADLAYEVNRIVEALSEPEVQKSVTIPFLDLGYDWSCQFVRMVDEGGRVTRDRLRGWYVQEIEYTFGMSEDRPFVTRLGMSLEASRLAAGV